MCANSKLSPNAQNIDPHGANQSDFIAKKLITPQQSLAMETGKDLVETLTENPANVQTFGQKCPKISKFGPNLKHFDPHERNVTQILQKSSLHGTKIPTAGAIFGTALNFARYNKTFVNVDRI